MAVAVAPFGAVEAGVVAGFTVAETAGLVGSGVFTLARGAALVVTVAFTGVGVTADFTGVVVFPVTVDFTGAGFTVFADAGVADVAVDFTCVGVPALAGAGAGAATFTGAGAAFTRVGAVFTGVTGLGAVDP